VLSKYVVLLALLTRLVTWDLQAFLEKGTPKLGTCILADILDTFIMTEFPVTLESDRPRVIFREREGWRPNICSSHWDGFKANTEPLASLAEVTACIIMVQVTLSCPQNGTYVCICDRLGEENPLRENFSLIWGMIPRVLELQLNFPSRGSAPVYSY
jgi:hypothetical protein